MDLIQFDFDLKILLVVATRLCRSSVIPIERLHRSFQSCLRSCDQSTCGPYSPTRRSSTCSWQVLSCQADAAGPDVIAFQQVGLPQTCPLEGAFSFLFFFRRIRIRSASCQIHSVAEPISATFCWLDAWFHCWFCSCVVKLLDCLLCSETSRRGSNNSKHDFCKPCSLQTLALNTWEIHRANRTYLDISWHT